jgi:ferrous iron transport protein A
MSAAALPLVPLEMLSAGEQGRIHDLDGPPEFVHRLEEMGLRIGAPVFMVQPGSPCILAVGNHRFSLRMEQAASVLVEVNA